MSFGGPHGKAAVTHAHAPRQPGSTSVVPKLSVGNTPLLPLLLLLCSTILSAFGVRGYPKPIACAATSGYNKDESPKQTPTPFVRTLVTMYVASFFLGPLLDNYHGLFGVLSYGENSLPFSIQWHETVLLKSALWVPLTFGGAGLVMTAILKALDDKFQTDKEVLNPSWPKIFYSISFFSGQYWLSGLLDNLQVPLPAIHAALAILAFAGWYVFDGSTAGALLGLCTAVAGIVTEVVLVSQDIYQYTHADFYGVCSWIPWVYFLGAPAVGNLARGVERAYHRATADAAE